MTHRNTPYAASPRRDLILAIACSLALPLACTSEVVVHEPADGDAAGGGGGDQATTTSAGGTSSGTTTSSTTTAGGGGVQECSTIDLYCSCECEGEVVLTSDYSIWSCDELHDKSCTDDPEGPTYENCVFDHEECVPGP